MYNLCGRIFPICRSITGNGVRETLLILKEHYPELKICEIPSGTKVFDWTIPKEWNIRDAWIKNSKGNKIVDFQKYKGGTRLFFHCGSRALADYQQKHSAIKRLAERFSCKPEGVEESVHKLEEELSQTKGRMGEKNRQLFQLLGQQMREQAPAVGEGKWLFLWDGGFTAEEAKAFAMAMAKVCSCSSD